MNANTHYQTILGSDGKPAFVVMPYSDFINLPDAEQTLSITAQKLIGRRKMAEVGLLQAWREHLMLTQTEVAARMGISQAGYAQIEAAKRPRRVTLQKVAKALGITLDQMGY
ncbi:MAG: helix-turn-helix transcriptional regulator [Methyloglobulus sp.]|nr:helix-turn-helix transcriptional regulator [Methyloglobulus sp.]